MMNDQFFRSYSNQQPSRNGQQKSSPKVIFVPVHFISSDQPRMTLSMLKDSAALTIQRVFRGFLVRKSVKKITLIRNEVGEIERRIDDIEVVDLIRRDAKERLRLNEYLMSLLFKLDSIRGVDYGIRDLRKTITRKAIALQEKVDSMAQADVDDHQTLTLDSRNNDSTYSDAIVVNEIICEAADGCECDAEDSSEMRKEEDDHIHNCVEGSSMEVELEKVNNEKGNKEEFLEKVMADNDKMMKLMMQIFERNEMQTRMINLLSRRVEQMEKAFMTSDRMRRKNKKTQHVALSRRRRDKDMKTQPCFLY